MFESEGDKKHEINSIYLLISVNVSCQLHSLLTRYVTNKKPGLISTQKGVFFMGAVQVHKTVDFNSRNATVPTDSK